MKTKEQVVEINDSVFLQETAVNCFLLAEMSYEKLGYSIKLVPSDPIEGDDIYKIELISPSGAKTIKYYDKKTGYLTKVVFSNGGISFFTDYFYNQRLYTQ